MRAIHGGKAKNDRIDSQKIAVLMRGGMFPEAHVYPREMRGTQDLMRRRMHLMRKRSELLAHVHNTNSQYNLPEIKKNLRYAFNREGIKERFADPSVQKSIELDLNLIDFYDKQLSKVEWHIHRHAKACDQHSLMLLRTVPGIGEILSLVILYEIHTIERFPTVQNFASYSRLIKCRKESAGKSYGTTGHKIGNAYLKWAFSEAAVLFLRKNPELLSNLVFTRIDSGGDLLGLSDLNTISKFHSRDHLCQVIKSAYAFPLFLCTLTQLKHHVEHPCPRQATL
jgi:transposase